MLRSEPTRCHKRDLNPLKSTLSVERHQRQSHPRRERKAGFFTFEMWRDAFRFPFLSGETPITSQQITVSQQNLTKVTTEPPTQVHSRRLTIGQNPLVCRPNRAGDKIQIKKVSFGCKTPAGLYTISGGIHTSLLFNLFGFILFIRPCRE